MNRQSLGKLGLLDFLNLIFVFKTSELPFFVKRRIVLEEKF